MASNPLIGRSIPELEGIARSGALEALVGAGGVVLGVGLAVLLSALGQLGQLAARFPGALVLGGFAALVHGLYRRRQARRALRDAPTARVV